MVICRRKGGDSSPFYLLNCFMNCRIYRYENNTFGWLGKIDKKTNNNIEELFMKKKCKSKQIHL